ncbi:hypothetical protein SSX86_031354 [Deinandra increscens subsp. villosa]|uniref:GRF-type domain-containing protein n=1 Tax=Deinandra increscens subsp. villosa TaxID=3103831 RepID=A0AAP0GIB3_9ASTR
MAVCYCGHQTTIRTSWTDANPGRRFYSCAQKESSCNFFLWVDPPMCRRAVEIIPGLLRSINELQSVAKRIETSNRRMKIILVFCLLYFVLNLVLGSGGSSCSL